MLIPTPRQLASLLAPTILLFASTATLAQPTAIQGSPYTAVEKIAFVQKLADGTTITRETTATMIRDSQGRTLRRETIPGPAGQTSSHTWVMDPVAHTITSWTTLSKQATRNHMPDLQQLPNRPASVGSGSGVGIGGVSGGMVSTSGIGITVAGPVLPGGAGVGIAGPVSDPNLKPTIKREKRDGKTIAGVYAEGVRITITYPTGSIGNDKPIVEVRETWTSPDLKLIVYSTNDDPRSGLQTTELTNLDRGEPDPALFQVPADYQVKDQYAGTNSASN
jgi:hypothetical protein